MERAEGDEAGQRRGRLPEDTKQQEVEQHRGGDDQRRCGVHEDRGCV